MKKTVIGIVTVLSISIVACHSNASTGNTVKTDKDTVPNIPSNSRHIDTPASSHPNLSDSGRQ
ncbi:MAG TPA: hypothetical protein VK783_10135 [Bacteroidia bacterium]|jgi:hypothetical protein|nr:hypothetical protein [Bacteroidia bacterium]